MAQWIETPEPYIKVQERVKTATQNPTAGESLIIGVAFISDAGPSTPTLITGQKEFLSTYASQDITKEYIEKLNDLYDGDDKTLPATMWSNAYRLAGSNTLLCVRASKANGIYYTKPIAKPETQDTYILRDGELLKKVGEFILTDYVNEDSPYVDKDGWLINISGVGIFGNRVTDDGAQYDYFCQNLPDLVENLNDTSKFFSPAFKFYGLDSIYKKYNSTSKVWEDYDIQEEDTITYGEDEILYSTDDIANDHLENGQIAKLAKEISVDMENQGSRSNSNIAYVRFTEVYLGQNIIDKDDPRTKKREWTDISSEEPSEEPADQINLSDIVDPQDEEAAVEKEIKSVVVLNSYLNRYVKFNYNLIINTTTYSYLKYNGTSETWEEHTYQNGDTIKYGETTPISSTEGITDMVDGDIAKITTVETTTTQKTVYAKGGISSEDNTGCLYIEAKQSFDAEQNIDLNDTSYSGFVADNYYVTNVYNSTTTLRVRIRKFNHNAVIIRNLSNSEIQDLTRNTPSPFTVITSTVDNLNPDSDTVKYQDFFEVAVYDPSVNEVVSFFNVGNITGRGDMESSEVNDLINMMQLTLPEDMHELGLGYYGSTRTPTDQIYCDVTIKTSGDDSTSILNITDSDLKRALDNIALDEAYVTEGLCDLGNTELSFQNYMANMAINDNYFYPISTVNSTNYMTIGNSATKIAADSYKLYMSAPWDIDTGTLGWRFYASPSVLYWETVARNRRNNREFAPVFGQDNGTMQYQRPVTEFNKKTRQLLLSKKVNTLEWDTAIQAWEMNDNFTKQIENTIMNDEGNSRLMIRISKAMPVILKQFLGKRISEKLCKDIEDTIKRFFKINILSMEYNIDGYQVDCKYDEVLARQNKVKVHVQVRYQRALKYIDVINDAIEIGMPFEEE